MGTQGGTASQEPGGARHSPYRLVSRATSEEFAGNLNARIVRVGGVEVGGPRPVVIAGPCAVESYEQTLTVARQVKAAGADMLRGGAFKPRTSPYDFQGLGEEGLRILAAVREETGLPIVTEVMDTRQVELVARHADVLQVGSRNMHNYPLLTEVGRQHKPVLLKRGMAASLFEWLCAAEYVALGGNLDIILCERGIRTFGGTEYCRNNLDLNVIYPARQRTFLPVIVDPSHGTGVAAMVPGAAVAAIGCGAHGLLIEVLAEDADPSAALCDGQQGIRPSALARIVEQIGRLS